MLKCHEILAFMPQDLAQEILDHAYNTDKGNYRLALKAVADARRVRPVFLQQKPRVERHKDMLTVLCRPQLEPVTGQLLSSWLINTQGPMLTDFMDALGIAHERGVIADCPTTVDDTKLTAAIDLLLGRYPQPKVAVYLNSFYVTCDVQWPKLAECLERDPRLQLV